MHIDILIFALVAVFLAFRLKAVLGTRHEDDTVRPNPFAAPPHPASPPVRTLAPPGRGVVEKPAALIDAAADADGRVSQGLDDIAAADAGFDVADFIEGAKQAFLMIVAAYNRADRGELKSLLSPKLYDDFERGLDARAGAAQNPAPPKIRAVQISAAHLGGVMAYITVNYDVEGGEAGPAVRDVWTFARDVRSPDPNWTLIETRAAGS